MSIQLDYDVVLCDYLFEHVGGLTFRLVGKVKKDYTGKLEVGEVITTGKFSSFDDEKVGDVVTTTDGLRYLLSDDVASKDTLVFN